MCKTRMPANYFAVRKKTVLWTRYTVLWSEHCLWRQVYMRTQLITSLLMGGAVPGRDEEGNLTGWVIDLWGSCLQHCPAWCELRCHSEEDTTSPSFSPSLLLVPPTLSHPIGLKCAFFRCVDTGLPSSCSLTLRVSFLLGVFAYHCIQYYYCFWCL